MVNIVHGSDNPETINKDPYGDGWMIKIDLTGEPSGLLDSAAYSESVAH